MNSEIELKLNVPPRAAKRVARLPWLRELASGPPKRHQLRTVYFDTRKLKLHDHGVVLRVRRADGRYLQSIKTRGSGENGPFGRGEWEYELPGDAPDLKLAKETPLGRFGRRKLKRKLRPIFETVVERTTVPIRADGADLELAIDLGHIKARGVRQHERIAEIEIEVKDGDRLELPRIAKQVARTITSTYGCRSKGDRGYALSRKTLDAAVRGEEILLDERSRTGEAFRLIGFSCLEHALANERAIRRGDTEGIHQMRIGLRRLRAAISVFKEISSGRETAAIKSELKWLAEQLGPARDLDVLIARQAQLLHDAPAFGADADLLERDLKTRRQVGIAKARQAMNSDRFRAIGLQVALWLAHGEWSRSDVADINARLDRPVDEFAAEVLAKRKKKIIKRMRNLEQLDAHARHKLRIAVKKLRYACDFFATVFSGRKRDSRRRRLCKLLNRLQSHLGTLNDIEVHKRFAHALAQNGGNTVTRSREALAMGFITGQEAKQFVSCIASLKKDTSKLHRLPAYWK